MCHDTCKVNIHVKKKRYFIPEKIRYSLVRRLMYINFVVFVERPTKQDSVARGIFKVGPGAGP